MKYKHQWNPTPAKVGKERVSANMMDAKCFISDRFFPKIGIVYCFAK
jgi:hypothetical protein